MKRLLTLTLCSLLIVGCSSGQANSLSKASSMSYSVATQAELDAGNQRINQYRQELLRQGFREVSVSHSDAKDEFVLEGTYGTLKDLRVTLWTGKLLQSQLPEFGGGISAFIRNEQAEREFEDLYKKVVTVVTGKSQ